MNSFFFIKMPVSWRIFFSAAPDFPSPRRLANSSVETEDCGFLFHMSGKTRLRFCSSLKIYLLIKLKCLFHKLSLIWTFYDIFWRNGNVHFLPFYISCRLCKITPFFSHIAYRQYTFAVFLFFSWEKNNCEFKKRKTNSL